MFRPFSVFSLGISKLYLVAVRSVPADVTRLHTTSKLITEPASRHGEVVPARSRKLGMSGASLRILLFWFYESTNLFGFPRFPCSLVPRRHCVLFREFANISIEAATSACDSEHACARRGGQSGTRPLHHCRSRSTGRNRSR